MYIWYVLAGPFFHSAFPLWICVFLLSSFGFAFQVCATEGANIQPQLLERLVGSCHGDIRKIIMHLQFWCQGKTFREGQLPNTCMLVWHLYACYCFLYGHYSFYYIIITYNFCHYIPLLIWNLHNLCSLSIISGTC